MWVEFKGLLFPLTLNKYKNMSDFWMVFLKSSKMELLTSISNLLESVSLRKHPQAPKAQIKHTCQILKAYDLYSKKGGSEHNIIHGTEPAENIKWHEGWLVFLLGCLKHDLKCWINDGFFFPKGGGKTCEQSYHSCLLFLISKQKERQREHSQFLFFLVWVKNKQCSF